MSRYIDADALKEYVNGCEFCNNCQHKKNRCAFDCDLPDYLTSEWERVIDEQPTVDAVPVVHGDWVEKWRFKPNGIPYHKVGDMECSVCHSDMLGRYYSRYCPHCGAKMDGKENADG